MVFINKKSAMLVATLWIGFSSTGYAELIPTNDSDFYYRIGGGHSVPVPAYDGTVRVPLNAEGEVGLGYNCGIFNPAILYCQFTQCH